MQMRSLEKVFLILFASVSTLQGNIQLPAIFSDHMVLTRAERVPVWGRADPDEAVSVSLGEAKTKSVADADGKWQAHLDLRQSGPGPFILIIEGKNRRVIHDVLVGEVWLCAGQSNMEWSLRSTIDAATEIARSANPLLRQFRVKKAASAVALDQCEGEWVLASSKTAERFSGVGYYFGKMLQKELRVPIGLINNSWGGTPIEAWISPEALESDADLREGSVRARKRFETWRDRWTSYLDGPLEHPLFRPCPGSVPSSSEGERPCPPKFTLLVGNGNFPIEPGAAPRAKDVAGFLYNAMVAPLIPYAIRGVVWYQGEANIERAFQYRTAFPMMIKDWRNRWKQGDLPFYFCQLANFGDKESEVKESSWAELREAQSLALKLPNTGQAVLIDVGEANDIHPRNKKDVGERLARIALARDYGRDFSWSGPTFRSAIIQEDKIVVTFTHTKGGLVARKLPLTHTLSTLASTKELLVRNSPDSQLEGFAICGVDRKWEWAEAKIEGDGVLVWSAKVPSPIAVRYAWGDNPTCNLYNEAGLPASPFRTDDFPLSTANGKY